MKPIVYVGLSMSREAPLSGKTGGRLRRSWRRLPWIETGVPACGKPDALAKRAKPMRLPECPAGQARVSGANPKWLSEDREGAFAFTPHRSGGGRRPGQSVCR